MSETHLDTAHEAWDRAWADGRQRAEWMAPDPFVTDYVPVLSARGATRVLDVGGGIGRHAIAYARAGFDVTMADASRAGVTEARRAAELAGVQVDVWVAPFTALPVPDSSVDHVLAFNVLYHGDRSVVAASLSECRRVLRNHGTLQITMLSKRNHGFGAGREIRADTFVDESRDGDKAHPHFYADAAGVCSLLGGCGFEVRQLVDVDQHPPGGWHWMVLAETATR